MLPPFFVLAAALDELPEAGVAVRDERSHAELVGERERVTEVALCVPAGITLSRGGAEKMERPRLPAPEIPLAGHGQRAAREFERVVEPPRK